MTLAALARRAGLHGRCLLIAAIAAGAMGAGAAPALGAAPEWGITMTHVNAYGAQEGRDSFSRSGKAFARDSAGNTYTITVTNEGHAPTSGPVEVVDELPVGMELYGKITEGEYSESSEPQIDLIGEEWGCTTGGKSGRTIGATSVRCTTEHSLAAGESYTPITLNVYVNPQAAPPIMNVATLKNVATVSGGGAVAPAESTKCVHEATKSECEDETTIAPAVPFGIFKFTTNLEELGAPFGEPTLANPLKQQQQAGGHPYSYTTEFELNPTNYSKTKLSGGGGGPEEVQVELPPGFIGDVQNTPQCFADVLRGGCPADTVVGYSEVHISGALAGGKAQILPSDSSKGGYTLVDQSLLYNMQPAPGSVAALGFVYDRPAGETGGIPFFLEAKVRSDGDYGITVGDNKVGNNPRPLGVKVVTCENGAIQYPAFENRSDSCNPAPASSKPFLTNPTQCSGPPPVTTIRSDPWDEPAPKGYSSVQAYANGPSAPYSEVNRPTEGTPVASSFVTGCDKLQFNPRIEFNPSPASEGGTSQADEPTGMTFDLKVPQTDEASALATPELKNVEMTLPAGMTASPAAADGLQACTKAQFWPAKKKTNSSGEVQLEEPEPAEHREPSVTAECPLASQIGAVEVFTPLLSGAPTVEGALSASTPSLTCSPGMWSGGLWSPDHEQLESGVEELENGNHERLNLSYQWLRNGVPIAAGKEYAAEPGDVGTAIQCQVTATNASGSSVAASRAAVGRKMLPEPTAPPLPPSSIATPSGTPSTGNMLTCENGAWAGNPTFTYRWLRGGAVIAGAESEKYTLVSADEGKVIQCQVTGKDAGGVVVADSAAVVSSRAPSSPPPLPGGALQGKLFQGQPECSPCTPTNAEKGEMLPLFIEARSLLGLQPGSTEGLIIKLHGVTKVNTVTGQLTSVFKEQPQQPFELFQLKLKGGPRAPLANPQSCGTVTTTAELTPWSVGGKGGLTGTEEIFGTPIAGSPGTSPLESPFNVESCSTPMPFAPSFNAGTVGAAATTAGASTDFSVTLGREDREQDLSGVTVHMPPGLTGRIPAVTLCGEAEALAQKEEAPTEGHSRPHCPAASEIGTAITLAGAGADPFKSEGKAYLTGPVKRGPFPSAPFNLLVDTPAEAGPFNLGHVVVLSGITVNPETAAVSVASEPLPQFVDGVQLRLRSVKVDVTKPNFMLNPTNCNPQQVSATLGGLQGASAQVASNFGITGCKGLLFHPTFTATTQAHTSKLGGASLDVKITYPRGSNYANIAKSITDLPIQLPSRLETLHKACIDTVFEANPAACPAGSAVGVAIAHTPLLNKPLQGPAYLVSHGGGAFPDLEIVLQGEGVTVVLDGHTDIKKGITKTTFELLPDSPIETFELNLPEGSNSILAAPENLCEPTKAMTVKKSVKVRRNGRTVTEHKTVTELVPEKLIMPTELVGQNGAVLKQNTVVGVTGCPPTVAITKLTLNGNALLVTVKTSAKGTVRISGKGLRTTTVRNLKAGTHEIRVALTSAGRSLRTHHNQTNVRAGLTVGKQAVATTSSARL